METQNLWPDFPVETAKSPKTILKEQAGFLMEKTSNVLSAAVETVQTTDGKMSHSFFIVAPALNNYRFRILIVSHGILYYPLEVAANLYTYNADNQEEFINVLSEIFQAPDTVRTISSLLSQSLAE